jgi:hypothetical protein
LTIRATIGGPTASASPAAAKRLPGACAC